MPQRWQTIESRPKRGGRLITRASLDEVELFNYAVKRDWRRDLDVEMRAEGHDYFWANITGDFASNPSNQPFPNNVTQKTIASLTRSGTTATVIITAGHRFAVGESVTVAGANQADYNGTFAIIAITRTTFTYAVAGAPATPATGTITVKSAMPINLVMIGRRPNGKTAAIVGTPTTLFRFFSLEQGAYVEGTGADAYVSETGPDTPYWETNPGDWLIIGQGFSVNGTRWEAVNINGYTTFNNGVDPLMTYRVEDSYVEVIYELREQGIAAVGTIAEFKGILMCGDISEIQESQLEGLFDPIGIYRGGDILLSMSGNAVTSNVDYFAAADVGKWIIFDDDTETTPKTHRQITGFTNARTVTVGGAAATITDKTFTIRLKAAQTGNDSSTPITATQAVGSTLATASSAFFNLGMEGKTLRYANGWDSLIPVGGFVSATQVNLTDAAPTGSDFTALPFFITESPADYTVTASAPIFTNEMVGRTISWDTGDVRRIISVTSTTQVVVDYDLPILSEYFGIENPATYGAYTETQYINRIQWMLINSMNDEPRRWASVIPGAMIAGTNVVTLNYSAKSFEVGQSVIVLGAGADGGNLTGEIIYIAANRHLTLDAFAQTTVGDADVIQSDAIGSIVGSRELQDDSSAILKMLELQGTLVIYKDTSIFLCQYTGDVAAPFDIALRKVPNGKTLFYRYTLIGVNSLFHVYAGRNAFYKFDLTTQVPEEIVLAELVKDIFFSQVTLANANLIFAADNSITKEIWFVFPSTSAEKALRMDYLQNTFSTTTTVISAAYAVKRPESGITIGPIEDWFVMGTAGGVVLVYGKSDQAVASWAAAKEIFYRRSANPFSATKNGYTSVLSSGMSAFGSSDNEKDIEHLVLLLGSQSASATILFELLGVRNVVEAAAVIGSLSLTTPKTRNQIPVHFRENYFQARLTVDGLDNPVRVVGIDWRVSGVNSQSFIRKQT